MAWPSYCKWKIFSTTGGPENRGAGAKFETPKAFSEASPFPWRGAPLGGDGVLGP